MSNVTQYTDNNLSAKTDLDLFAERIKTYIEPMVFGKQVGYVDALMEARGSAPDLHKVYQAFKSKREPLLRSASSHFLEYFDLASSRVQRANTILFRFYLIINPSYEDDIDKNISILRRAALQIMLPEEYSKVFGA